MLALYSVNVQSKGIKLLVPFSFYLVFFFLFEQCLKCLFEQEFRAYFKRLCDTDFDDLKCTC